MTPLLLDCTGPGRLAEPWFQAALAACGVQEMRTASPGDGTDALDGAAALIISGSPRDAVAKDNWTRAALELTSAAISCGMPVFGVCYGHQLLGRLAGARVARNPLGWEGGECVVQATDEPSPLGFEGGKRVLESHQDSVFDAPAGTRILATNEHSAVQAAEWAPGVYGVQFHPEFTGPILRGLWESRRDEWRGRTSFDLDAKLDAAQKCEDGLAVLRRFLEIIPRS